MAGGTRHDLVGQQKKRKAEEGSSQHGPEEKRPRDAQDEQTSTCHHGEEPGPPPDRASTEPAAADGSPKLVQAVEQRQDVGHSGAQEMEEDAVMAHAAAEDEDGGLPRGLDELIHTLGSTPEALDAAEAAAAAFLKGDSVAAPTMELSLGAPAETQANRLHAPPAPIKSESALLPQCAVLTGAPPGAAEQEVSTRQVEQLPAREPTVQYHAAKASLHAALIPPGQAGVSWDAFPNYLGEGIRARLLSLATLHLSVPPAPVAGQPAPAPFPAAVKELPANSNRVLLGAANSCELYQERVMRALAQKVGAPLLVADVYNLKLDEVLKDDAGAGGAPGLMDDVCGSGSPAPFPPDPWDVSDEDDPFLMPGLGKPGKREGEPGKDSLDTALAMRAKANARRGAMPGMAYFSLGAPGGRQPSGLAGAAASERVNAAFAAAEAAKEIAVAARAKATAAKERCEAAQAGAAAAKAAAAAFGAATAKTAAAGAAAPVERTASIGVPAGEQQQQDLAAMMDDNVAESDALRLAAGAAPPAEQHAEAAEAAAAGGAAAAQDGAPQQPAASGVASGPAAAAALVGGASLDPASKAAVLPKAVLPLDGRAQPVLPAASAAPGAGGEAASKAPGPALRRGDRISYVGRVHPSLAAAQERLDQLQAAIHRVESSASQRARDYLPQLLVRRTLVAAQSQRVPRLQPSGTPPIGSRGRVLGVTGEKVQLVFDEAFTGGQTLPGQKDKSCFVCSADEVQVVDDKEDPLVTSLQALFDVVTEVAEQGPLIVFIQNLDRLLRTHATDHFRKLEALLASLPPRCLLFGGYCSRSLARAEAKREGGPPGLSRLFGSLGGDAAFGAPDDLSLLDRFGRGPGSRSQRKSTKGKVLSKMLPNHLELHPPNHESQGKAWKKMIESDVSTMRQRSNRTAVRKALGKCGMTCDDWDVINVTDCQLARKEIEQVVGMAVASQLAAESSAAVAGGTAAAEAVAAVAAAAAAEQQQEASQQDTQAAAGGGGGGSGEGAVAMEHCGSAEQESASAAAQQPEEQQQQQAVVGPAGEQQPSVMQLDERAAAAAAAPAAPAAGALATAASGPAVTTAAGGQGCPAAGDTQQAGAAAAVAGEQQEAAGPLWTLRAQHIMAAADSLRKMQQEAAAQPEKQGLKDVAVDQYEKQLLSEVIPPEEINVSFDDIGALEAVKNTLHEVVILPLQRPELFTRGALTKPTKGLLLFGPPGTGKTMLAKAVASESGAHFINVNMSSITSKWFGEGERLVRALFGLAHKLSPSVIFVDEIDSFLSKRGQSSNEHEALRKMKNEFMTHWDGLRTKQSDRVLVLAATNRPMDLDDAVIRRMPRRIFVPLPDATNRERILQVILQGEDLEPSFDFKEAAQLSDGYSGSDLKNLCIAAAYCPIREYLEKERAVKAAEKAAGRNGGGLAGSGRDSDAGSAGGAASAAAAAATAAASSAMPAALAAVTTHVPLEPVRLRSMTMSDFKEALKQVTASTHSDSASSGELQRWNDQYGEGGSRRKEPLAYYT